MKKLVLMSSFLLLTLLIIPSTLAINIKVEKQGTDEVYVKNLEKPIVFYLKITNNEPSDSFEFYNLLGFSMLPSGKISIAGGEAKEVKVEITPLAELPNKGYYTLTYFIKASDRSEVEQNFTFALSLADYVCVMSKGKIVYQSTPEELKHNEQIKAQYLGV